MISNRIHLRLSNFNDDTTKYILKKARYESILDFELKNNTVFELIMENNLLLVPTNNDCAKILSDYYICNIPMSSLNSDVKQYLYWETNIKCNYANFEHYFNENYKLLSPIKMFIPIKKEITSIIAHNIINKHTTITIDIVDNDENNGNNITGQYHRIEDTDNNVNNDPI